MKTTEQNFLSASSNEKECNYQLEHDTCEYVIYVDIKNIPLSELTDWLIDNARYFSNTNNGSIFKIDLIKMATEEIASEWLRMNQNYIDYKETSVIIECLHRITKVPADILNGSIPEKYRLTLGTIKKMITEKNGNFDTDKYDKHVRFFEYDGELRIELVKFQKGMNCFSFPLLRKIASKGLDDSSKFGFYIINGGEIIFSVNYDNLEKVYYDFSHIPPIMGDESVYAS